MRLSDDQITHLTNLLAGELGKSQLITLKKTLAEARQVIARELRDELRGEDEIDAEVRRRLASYSRRIREGTSEWEVMYQQHYQQALRRRGLA
ncbi:MAG: DUF507 family protein [Candidatus Tectomicrobia bacterium]|nr:DUF507 family protein [Candidatus Tectomicrobia bacterium]